MSLVTASNLAAGVQATMDDTLLSIKRSNLIHQLAAETRRLKARGGRTLRVARIEKLPLYPVPLGDSGAPIPSTNLVRTDHDSTMSFYGQYVAINQQVILQNQEDVLLATAEVLGVALRETEDLLVRQMMQASATAYNCTGGANGDLPTDLSTADFDEVSAVLMSADAVMVLDAIQAEDRFGTGPTRNAYLAMGHTNLSKDLNNLDGFISQWNYPNQNQTIQKSEYGAINQVRILLSSLGAQTPFASGLGNTVYDVFVQGMEAVCTVEQDNYSAQFIYRDAMFSDALAQNVTVSAVFAKTSMITQDQWIVKMRCTTRN